MPIGVIGELYIGGRGLGRGYYQDPEKTALKFIPHPFSQKVGDRLYKTGDLARYLPDGNIEFIGRDDNQIKIRGFRIELGEIETVLANYEAIREAVIVAHKQAQQNHFLVAYLVFHQNHAATIPELRQYLKDHLPDYMIPTAFVTLDALPLTPNGKVDRRALPAPEMTEAVTGEEFIPPETPTEQKVAEVWSNVLNHPKVGIHDNFFALGGHSLLATQLISQLQMAFSITLSIQTLFQKPTVYELAQEVDQGSESASLLRYLKLFLFPELNPCRYRFLKSGFGSWTNLNRVILGST